MDFGNILVIFMCVVVVGVGLYSFLSEYIFNKEADTKEKTEKQDLPEKMSATYGPVLEIDTLKSIESKKPGYINFISFYIVYLL